MKIRARRCPKCDGRLIFEAIGSYGDLYNVNIKTGKPCKKPEHRAHYEYGDYTVYCQQCYTTFEFTRDKNGVISLFYNPQER